MRVLAIILVVATCFVNVGCTKIQVTPLDRSLNVKLICIELNKNNKVEDMLGVIEAGIARHGMTSRTFESNSKPAACEYVMRYNTMQAWDISTYLSYAELQIFKDDNPIASAFYKSPGGISPSKWHDTKTKMDPIIDELFSGR